MAGKKKAAVASKARKPKQRDAVKKLGKKADMSEFRAQLDSIGVKIVEVTADGNCFFRAMGDQLEGDEEKHMKYREMVVHYIVEHREEFEPFIEDEVPFDEYCDSMMKDGTWAGNMELQAGSLVTNRNICIHMLNSPRWYINNFSGREASNMVHLSYHHGEHYNSVRLTEDPCQGPAMPVVIKVLAEFDGDVDAAVEYMIAERVAVGSDNVDGDLYMDYACKEDELSTSQNGDQIIYHKEEESCSSKDETVQKSKSSHAKKDKSNSKECSCGSAKKHKASCSLATAVASKAPPRTKGGQGKAQKGKKQKKKEPEAAPVKERKSTVPLPDLGALCI